MRLVIVMVFLLHGIWGMTQTVQGLVYLDNNKTPAMGVVVLWKDTRMGTTTDDKGKFSMLKPISGEALVFYLMGYKTDTVTYNQWIEHNQEWVMHATSSEMNGITAHGHHESSLIHSLDPQKFQIMTEQELCKAACCNLSESFETNASVDASFTDGVTGTRQIKMLGLDGKYSMIMTDNIPGLRGLTSTVGLGLVPGPWVNSIHISKGVGSVLPGYESIAGQINIQHKGDEMKEKGFVNVYLGNQGRAESNLIVRLRPAEHFQHQLMVHSADNMGKFDMNHDGFLDNPLGTERNVRWHGALHSEEGYRGDYSAQITKHKLYSGTMDNAFNTPWNADYSIERAEFTAKNGWVFEEDHDQSLGSQISISQQQIQGVWGRENPNSTYYNALQQFVRINLLYAFSFNESVKITYGILGTSDRIKELAQATRLGTVNWNRWERTGGAYAEVNIDWHKSLQAVIGMRFDYSNYYQGWFTPRAHIRYALNEHWNLKFLAGTGRRSCNPIMDQPGILASSRNIVGLEYNNAILPLGLPQEQAGNYGIVLTQKGKLFYRDCTFSLDAFSTRFKHQVVVDWDTWGLVRFYALRGSSVSNTFQVEGLISPAKRLEVRMAYRYVNSWVDYSEGRRMLPFVSKNRTLINVAYFTRWIEGKHRFSFDATAKWNDGQRLPISGELDGQVSLPSWAPAFWIANGQVSFSRMEKWDLYVGVENLFNYQQGNAVYYSNDYLDANFTYAPVFGRMAYLGFRWRIGSES